VDYGVNFLKNTEGAAGAEDLKKGKGGMRGVPPPREPTGSKQLFYSAISWQKKLLRAVGKYPAKGKLVGSMARKCREVLKPGAGSLDD